MLDYRMNTFLTLCETMNYRETAQKLNLTQPAVTGHIHFLEHAYDCRLFSYDGRTLHQTAACKLLEQYAKSANYDQQRLGWMLEECKKQEKKAPILRIGATKTIGNYMMHSSMEHLLTENKVQPSLLVDNTATLLRLLSQCELDIALVEGFFDRDSYDSHPYRNEPFVGICSKTHPFAGRSITHEQLLKERLFLREEGSGTRAILEQVLAEDSYTIDNFASVTEISSFEVTKNLVIKGFGISFVYQAVANSSDSLATFTLKGHKIIREMNYVYLKGGNALEWIPLLHQSP